MPKVNGEWEPSLEQAGSAGPTTLRHGAIFTFVILLMTVVVIAFGKIQLAPNPQFTNFHMGFLLPVDAVTAFVLFGQYVYRRLSSYLVLAAAFLFSALITLPFLFSFPGAVSMHGPLIGGEQSAIWLWHLWHILFPAIIAASLIVHERFSGQVPQERTVHDIALTIQIVLLAVLVMTAAVTIFHDALPVLIDNGRTDHGATFYVVGGAALLVTVLSLGLAIRLVARRATLHIWIAVVLLAWLGDVAASLAAPGRYTVAWYFGRVDSMLAASMLLVVFLSDINRLYRKLSQAMRELVNANSRLSGMVDEKDTLLMELRLREEHIRRLAYHDAVTDLPNRRLLLETLTHILAQAARHGHETAVLFLDLDNFKQVNDTLGHETGDALLREVATRVGHCVRRGDTVSRLGGDEFVIVLPEIPGVNAATAVAEKILDALGEGMVVSGHPIHVSASVGIAFSGAGGEFEFNADQMVRLADEAMYAAKKAGKNRYWVRCEGE